MTNEGELNVNGGALTNDGTLTNAGELVVADSGTVQNNGTITSTGTIQNSGTITSTGTVSGEISGNGDFTQQVTGVELEPSELSLTVGETQVLTATVQPENATNKSVTWSSSDSKVATVETIVDNRKIKADGSNRLIVDGVVKLSENGEEVLSHPAYAWLEAMPAMPSAMSSWIPPKL